MNNRSKTDDEKRAPGPDDIHVWFFRIDQAGRGDLEKEPMILGEDEEKLALRIRHRAGRLRYRATRTLVRNMLSHYCPEISPWEWEFGKNEFGKPHISEPVLQSPLYFNLSHSGDRIALAASGNPRIGVDVESTGEGRDVLAIARRYFSPADVAELGRLAPEDRLRFFYELWTLKEAFSKACGEGLVSTLGQLGLRFEGEQEIGVTIGPGTQRQGTAWQLWLYDDVDYRLAVAA